MSVDGVSRTRSPIPSSCVATQNPIEYEGTYPLPEAQLDRFLAKLDVGYPDAADEAAMLRLAHRGVAPATLDDVQTRRRARGAARRPHARRRDDRERRGDRLRRRARAPHTRAAERRARREPARRGAPARGGQGRGPPRRPRLRRPRRRRRGRARRAAAPPQLRPEAELERYTADDAVRDRDRHRCPSRDEPDAARRASRSWPSRSVALVRSRSRDVGARSASWSCSSAFDAHARAPAARACAARVPRRRRAWRRSRAHRARPTGADLDRVEHPAGAAARRRDRTRGRARRARRARRRAAGAARTSCRRRPRARTGPLGLGRGTFDGEGAGELLVYPDVPAAQPPRDRAAPRSVPRSRAAHARAARARHRLRVDPRLPTRRRRPPDQLARDRTRRAGR